MKHYLFFFAVITCFLLARPYTGIWHDDVLYTAQALNKLHADYYKDDLFFLFGSQDNLSVFSELHSRMIAVLGIYHANLVSLVLCQALWLSGSWCLIKRLLPAPWHWLAILLVASMPRYYGNGDIFSYGEVLLSARLPAEALGLWSIALILGGRKPIAFVTAIAAFLIHPIMGIVSGVLVLMIALPGIRWWFIALITLGCVTLLELLGWGLPLRYFDPIWQELTRLKSPFIFVTNWSLSEWSQACWVLALPVAMAVDRTSDRANVWGKAALIGFSGMAIATLADLFWQDAFLIQIQSWRVLWLLSVLQWPCAIGLLLRDWPRRRNLLLLLASCWLFLGEGGGLPALSMACLLHLSQKFPDTRVFTSLPRALSSKITLVPLLIFAISMLYWLASNFQEIPTAGVNFIKDTSLTIQWLEGLIHTRLALLLALFAFLAIAFGGRLLQLSMAGCLIFLIVYGVFNLDQRAPLPKFIEANMDKPQNAPFSGIVKPGNLVFWEGDIRFPWLMMKTANYFSRQQSAGIVFKRETAIEALRRSARLREKAIQPSETTPQSSPANLGELVHLREPNFKSLSRQQLHFLCQDPILDYVVLSRNYPEWSIAEYNPSAIKQHQWLYDCHALRQSQPPMAHNLHGKAADMQSHY